MDLISDSGAITDINEIAANFLEEIPAEELTKIENTSLEDLLEDLQGTVDEMQDIPEDAIDTLGLVPAMESLMNVVTSIRDSGGISRGDVATLQSMSASMEGFQDIFKCMPACTFTELPSKVNYNASMENMVTAFFKKLVEAIKRFIEKARQVARDFFQSFGNQKLKAAKLQSASQQAEKKLKESGSSEEPIEFYSNEFCKWFSTDGNGRKFAAAVVEGGNAIGKALATGNVGDVAGAIGKISALFDIDAAGITGIDVAQINKIKSVLRRMEATSTVIKLPSKQAYKDQYLTAFNDAYKVDMKGIYDTLGANAREINTKLSSIDVVIRTQVFLKSVEAAPSIENNEQYQLAATCYGLMEVNNFLGRLVSLVMRGQLNIIRSVWAL